MRRLIRTAGRHWWSIAVALCLVAVAGLRFNVWAGPKGPEDNRRLRYVCIGDLAVDLSGERYLPLPDQFGFISPQERAQRGCELPHFPRIEEARFVAAGTSPQAGFGSVIIELDGDPPEVLTRLKDPFVRAGWQQSPASELVDERIASRQLIAFEREDAWLWATAVPSTLSETGSTVVLTGSYAPSAWRNK